MAELNVTSGKAWRRLREEGQLVELPSGFVARLRPVGLIELWKLGKIPDTLTSVVVELLTAQQMETERALKNATENMKNIAALYDVVCTAAFIEPRVVDNPVADNEISADDIDQADKEYILSWVNAPAVALRRFRPVEAANVDTVPEGQPVPQAAQPSDGGNGRVGSLPV